MNLNHKIKRAVGTLAFAAALVVAPPAVAHGGWADKFGGWPEHFDGGRWCIQGYPHIFGNMPVVRSQNETMGTIDGSGNSTPSYNQWIYYRIQVQRVGSTQWRAGNWMRVLNAYQGGEGGVEEQQPNGSWQRIVNYGYDVFNPGSSNRDAASRVDLAYWGTYHVYGEYWWAPFSNYGWLGPHFTYLGAITCTA